MFLKQKEQFLAGNAAMFNSGAWDIGDFEGSDIASKIGFFWRPYLFRQPVSSSQIGIKASGGVYVVSSKVAEDPALLDAIMQFWQFYYGEEGTKIIAEDIPRHYRALHIMDSFMRANILYFPR